ncbi:hypothetical protein RHSIM_Rhsim02G0025800 [Rhododendron simsii]|uniref:Uncharacterized protein n=1 Tax=Rhododendron simsii TaxID=118357 RepID=A0A834HBM0_RHOSS|nr:hypothetical protein RHSIM_Rhsim02G0025800 [Rhododendron simsii]
MKNTCKGYINQQMSLPAIQSPWHKLIPPSVQFYGDKTWKLGGKCCDVLKSKVSGTRQGGRAAGTSGFNTAMRLSSKEYSPQVGKTEAQI